MTEPADDRVSESFAVTAITKLAHAKLLALADSHGGIAALADEVGIGVETLRKWVYLRAFPRGQYTTQDGRVRRDSAKTRVIVQKLCEMAEASPEELFPGFIREKLTGRNLTQKTTRTVTVKQLTQADTRRLTYIEDHRETDAMIDLPDNIEEALRALPYREREIIKLRYGLGGSATHTLEEMAHIFKVTKERIRQLEMRALQNLRLRLGKGLYAYATD